MKYIIRILLCIILVIGIFIALQAYDLYHYIWGGAPTAYAECIVSEDPPIDILILPSIEAELEQDAVMLAKIMYKESRGVKDMAHQAAVAWCILNRVDVGYGTIEQICTAPNQFAWDPNAKTVDDFGRDLVWLALDVLARWQLEKLGETEVGRVLPKEYLYFSADKTGTDNVFRTKWKQPYKKWDWSLPNPYELAPSK